MLVNMYCPCGMLGCGEYERQTRSEPDRKNFYGWSCIRFRKNGETGLVDHNHADGICPECQELRAEERMASV